MEKQTKTITIGRNRYGFYYRDNTNDMSEILMIEAFGMLIARLAGTIQHNEDNNQMVEYQIDITRTMMD